MCGACRGFFCPSERKFHFISGLPRAGSTLTAAILRQNPRFHAGMSSPVASLFDGVIAQVSAGSELATMVNEAAARAHPARPVRLLLCRPRRSR